MSPMLLPLYSASVLALRFTSEGCCLDTRASPVGGKFEPGRINYRTALTRRKPNGLQPETEVLEHRAFGSIQSTCSATIYIVRQGSRPAAILGETTAFCSDSPPESASPFGASALCGGQLIRSSRTVSKSTEEKPWHRPAPSFLSRVRPSASRPRPPLALCSGGLNSRVGPDC